MSYLNNFKYDVFLSYAHADNKTLNDSEDGWITQFYKQFKLQLDRYLDGTNTAEVWCDHELRKNYAFDDRIEKVIKNSAIFLAFTSNSFYRSEYCCDKELAVFYQTATEDDNLGLKIDDSNRLFQIQLLNKPHAQWPKEFQGVGCYEMFRYSNPNSLKRDEDQGITLSPELDPKEYNNRILEIVQDVSSTLKLIKNKQVPILANQPKAKKVFFSKVAHTLIPLREQISKELEANNISVYKCELPPPYDKDEHKREVSEKILSSDLSVHMFDSIAGDKISAGYPNTFLQEQALIAKGLKKEQFIFISQELDFDKVDDDNHGKFLSNFLTEKEQDARYNLIREFSVPGIVDHIKDKLIEPPPLPPIVNNSSILLDFNEVDFKYAFEYYNSLMLENRKIFLTIPGTGPLDSIKKFEIALKEVNTVIIVCVTAAQEWLKERIIEIIRAIRTEKSGILKLSVYRDSKLNDLDLNTLCQFI
ncbi:MAG: hypothetical protein ABIN01_05475 [Ferruginibacter sp.]